jgi:hypothetical protein
MWMRLKEKHVTRFAKTEKGVRFNDGVIYIPQFTDNVSSEARTNTRTGSVFMYTTMRSPFKVNQPFGATCHLHYRG